MPKHSDQLDPMVYVKHTMLLYSYRTIEEAVRRNRASGGGAGGGSSGGGVGGAQGATPRYAAPARPRQQPGTNYTNSVVVDE